MKTIKVLITGGSGFLGRSLINQCVVDERKVIAPVRKSPSFSSSLVEEIIIDDIADLSTKSNLINDCHFVIHLAAKAHVIGAPLESFLRVNTKASLDFALKCAREGVKRFIYVSSIGVNGIRSDKPFTASDIPAPVEDYAVSKLEAELGLKKIATQTGMEVVIIRPPLVYGPSAPGNFGKLSKLAQKNLPLPLGSIHNKRSLVALDNLVDLIVTCIDHPKAANQTFLVSDDNDVSTTELIQMMTRAAGKKPRLLPVPVSWLRLMGKITGKQAVIDRLCGNLQVDISHTKDTLGWKPPITVEEGIRRCFAGSE